MKGTQFTVQKALALLVDGASIIMTGSTAGVKGIPSFGVYSANKATIRSFVNTCTNDLKSRNIGVNVISSGPVETAAFPDILDGQEAKRRFASMVPNSIIGKPEEIASAALFLASRDSTYVTGIELFVDGGVAQI